ncbi:MAG: hydroxyacylglutathione hydrolase [Alphaproteobacteria bacterium]|nr:hydroxyacylglutathione hydrolase [Alphaproteobacteria bacterium]
MLQIEMVPILEDNYCYLLRSEDGKCAVLDPGEAPPVIDALEKLGWTPDYILNTHHHWDHVNGNKGIKDKYGSQIFVPEGDAHKIKHYDHILREADIFELGNEKAKIIATPGHTMGAICYYFEKSKALFTGDTLFAMGCGRLFEGSAEDMFGSLQKIFALPDDVKVYCGHEYTLGNAQFCSTYAPENIHIQKRLKDVIGLRKENKKTIPSTLSLEKKTNIFLMAKTVEEFAGIRSTKDRS